MLRDSKFQRVLIAGVLIIIALALYQVDVRLHITDAFSLSISDLLMIAAAVAAGYPIAVNAFQAIRFRIVGIDALVTLAVVGAILIRESGRLQQSPSSLCWEITWNHELWKKPGRL